jgi:D-glycero-D-manno-heptose 1,7-bisphosphate phosphatase
MGSPGATRPPLRPAVFLDRDGTLVDDPGFLNDPERVRLLPGAAPAVRRLAEAGYAVVVVTNQSGIARGLISWEQYQQVARRVEQLLAAEGARLAAVYTCPHHPDLTGPCDCRKPGLALYRQAAADLSLALDRSIWIGDRMTDLEPARAFGGRAVMVLTGQGGRVDDQPEQLGIEIVADLAAAATRLLG